MKKTLSFLAVALAILVFKQASAQIGITYFPGPGSPASTSGSSCTGTLDLSTGCPQPMLGVM